MFRRLASLLAALALLGTQPAHAWTHGVGASGGVAGGMRFIQRRTALGAQAFHGPGSRGFLGTCTGRFSVANDILQSNTFNTTWTLQGAATITGSSATAPDGSSTATSLSIPATTGSQQNALQQNLTNQALNFDYTNSIWVQVTSSAVNGTVYVAVEDGATWINVRVPNDGKWHQVNNYFNGSALVFGDFFEIGVDLRPGSQVANTGIVTYNVWHASSGQGRAPGGGAWPYQATTTSVVTSTQTLPCPAGVAYRDFTHLAPYGGNPITSPNVSEAWQAGGVSVPRYGIGGVVAGTPYAFTAVNTSPYSPNLWLTMSLYKRAVSNPFLWSEVPSINPIIQTPGSAYASNTKGSDPLSFYMLHSTVAPSGCTISATHYAYCFYVSGMDSSNNMQVYVWYSNAITGAYTVYNAGTATALLTPIPAFSVATHMGLPAIVQVGSTYYLYTSVGNSDGQFQLLWTSPASDGINWTFQGQSYRPAISGDWDASPTGIIDPVVYKNACGFYEYFYTDFVGSQQKIGYMVSDSPQGPWFKSSGPIFPYASTIYYGTNFIGDTVAYVQGGKLIMYFDITNGSTTSTGVAATMSDACSY